MTKCLCPPKIRMECEIGNRNEVGGDRVPSGGDGMLWGDVRELLLNKQNLPGFFLL